MIRNEHGFSLVELIVALVVFLFAIAAATSVFIPLVSRFKQQSKIAETNIEGLVGLEMLKTDLEQAGYGLPWYFQNPIAYNETAATPAASTINGAVVNDAPGNPPRAVAAFNNVSSFNGQVNGNPNITGGIVKGSDYLVIKSASVSGTDAAQKWSYVVGTGLNPRTWGATGVPGGLSSPQNDPSANDNVIAIVPTGCCDKGMTRTLEMNGSTFSTSFSNVGTFSSLASCACFGASLYQTIYDIDPNSSLKMPFNRADYFVGIPAAMPTRCASGTGVLYKAVLSQDGTFHASNATPLLDCVADMQVVFGLDMNGDGTIDTYSNADGSYVVDATNITGQGLGLGSAEVQSVLTSQSDLSYYRSSLVEVRIYILAHEGQKDPNYTYPNNSVLVGEPILDPNLGRTFNFGSSLITNWQNYRWKVYVMVVKLQNTR